MRKGWVSAVGAVVVLAALLWLMPHTSNSSTPKQQGETTDSEQQGGTLPRNSKESGKTTGYPQVAARSYAPNAESKSNTSLDQKVREAVAIIESGQGAPMQAIFTLREVVEEDPNHLEAQYQLGRFAMMSGQNDKAVPRFEIVLDLQPDNEAAAEGLFLARVQLGEKEAAQIGLREFLTSYPNTPGASKLYALQERLQAGNL